MVMRWLSKLDNRIQRAVNRPVWALMDRGISRAAIGRNLAWFAQCCFVIENLKISPMTLTIVVSVAVFCAWGYGWPLAKSDHAREKMGQPRDLDGDTAGKLHWLGAAAIWMIPIFRGVSNGMFLGMCFCMLLRIYVGQVIPRPPQRKKAKAPQGVLKPALVATMLLAGCMDYPDREPYPTEQTLHWSFQELPSQAPCGEIPGFTGPLTDLCDFAILTEGYEVWCREGAAKQVRIQPSPVNGRWVGSLVWVEDGCESTYDVEGRTP